VLNDRMEDSGVSISSLNFFSSPALLPPLTSKVLTYDTVTDNNTDSAIEQRNEINSAKIKYVRSKTILSQKYINILYQGGNIKKNDINHNFFMNRVNIIKNVYLCPLNIFGVLCAFL